MKMTVKLKAAHTDYRGRTFHKGKTIGVNRKTGKRLIAAGKAVGVSPAEEVPRVTTAVINPRDLRGDAKKDWLRGQIEKAGKVPSGDTIAALAAQLRGL